jgi:hypothetical protein
MQYSVPKARLPAPQVLFSSNQPIYKKKTEEGGATPPL